MKVVAKVVKSIVGIFEIEEYNFKKNQYMTESEARNEKFIKMLSVHR